MYSHVCRQAQACGSGRARRRCVDLWCGGLGHRVGSSPRLGGAAAAEAAGEEETDPEGEGPRDEQRRSAGEAEEDGEHERGEHANAEAAGLALAERGRELLADDGLDARGQLGITADRL